MDKFMHFVEDKMSPIADKLGEQRHLSAMQKGFMTVLPLIFVGAVFMVIANPPVTADNLVVFGQFFLDGLILLLSIKWLF